MGKKRVNGLETYELLFEARYSGKFSVRGVTIGLWRPSGKAPASLERLGSIERLGPTLGDEGAVEARDRSWYGIGGRTMP
jgi:hypothetical protein